MSNCSQPYLWLASCTLKRFAANSVLLCGQTTTKRCTGQHHDTLLRGTPPLPQILPEGCPHAGLIPGIHSSPRDKIGTVLPLDPNRSHRRLRLDSPVLLRPFSTPSVEHPPALLISDPVHIYVSLLPPQLSATTCPRPIPTIHPRSSPNWAIALLLHASIPSYP